jgi:hypothetical protein
MCASVLIQRSGFPLFEKTCKFITNKYNYPGYAHMTEEKKSLELLVVS